MWFFVSRETFHTEMRVTKEVDPWTFRNTTRQAGQQRKAFGDVSGSQLETT